jgi:hypothetical protein
MKKKARRPRIKAQSKDMAPDGANTIKSQLELAAAWKKPKPAIENFINKGDTVE